MNKVATYTPTHPIIFVFDPGNRSMNVPCIDAGNIVSSNGSCISVRTIADVDGDVEITLSRTPPALESAPQGPVFNGQIATPNRIVAIVTSEDRTILMEQVDDVAAMVSVYVDDLDQAARIWVVVT